MDHLRLPPEELGEIRIDIQIDEVRRTRKLSQKAALELEEPLRWAASHREVDVRLGVNSALRNRPEDIDFPAAAIPQDLHS